MDRHALAGVASLLRAGLLPSEAVESLRRNGTLRGPEGGAIRAALAAGRRFHEAVAPYLPPDEAAILAAAEESGRLVENLDRLAEIRARREQERRSLLTELAYPIGLFLLAAVLLPIATGSFADGRLLGPSWLRGVAWALGPPLLLLALAIHPRVRRLLRGLVRRVPGFAQADRHRRRAEFCGILGAALEAGILPSEALPLAARAAGADGSAAALAVAGGRGLADAAAGVLLLEPGQIARLGTAEQAGETTRELERLALESSEIEAQIRRRALLAVGKGIYLLVALWIAFRVISFYAGLYGSVKW